MGADQWRCCGRTVSDLISVLLRIPFRWRVQSFVYNFRIPMAIAGNRKRRDEGGGIAIPFKVVCSRIPISSRVFTLLASRCGKFLIENWLHNHPIRTPRTDGLRPPLLLCIELIYTPWTQLLPLWELGKNFPFPVVIKYRGRGVGAGIEIRSRKWQRFDWYESETAKNLTGQQASEQGGTLSNSMR